ncbi:MAG: hypothetical protein A2231_10125 [Candidatus Firestonebacteria bacterium RIFOXYA2_FULL_40_8]|nr:MAG: hypothetical protein A2231_10125 [Candidatus Firestonebacteria bacterium RIFOXYA2_FULL_40_8]
MPENDSYIGVSTRPTDKKYEDWDNLGFNEAKEAFIRVVKSAKPPLTIGLYGTWGSGKTEMIKAISQEITEETDSKYLTLIFDAWKYRNESNIILPLICALERKYPSEGKVKESAKKILFSAAIVMANAVVENKTGVDISEIKDELEAQEKGYEHYKKYNDKVSELEDEFKVFVEKILESNNKSKLVIFIDNLDRCLPDIVVNLLEDISCFLSIENSPCVFFLAVDKENVIKAIKNKHKDFDGSHYLEKIVQVSLSMPGAVKRPDQDASWTMYHLMKRYMTGQGYQVESRSGDPMDQIHELLKKMSYIFSSDYLANPRRIERIVNKIIVLEKMQLVSLEKSIKDVPVLVFLLLLKEHFPEVYDNISFEESYYDLYRSLRKAKLHFNANKIDKERDKALEDENTIFNIVLSRYYYENDKYYEFLCLFMGLFEDPNFIIKLMQYKKHLELVG